MLCSQSIAAVADIKVLNTYPNCDYTVLDSVTYTHNVGLASSIFDRDEVPKESQRIIARMQQKAAEHSADAIILVERDLEVVDLSEYKSTSFKAPTHHTLSLTAELIRLCVSTSDAPSRPTPFNAEGAPQKEISLGTFGGWQHTIALDVSGRNKRIVTKVDNTISLADGAFGAQLGMSPADTSDILGTPTFSVQANNEALIWAYGRGLWLVFKQDKLVSISSQQVWFSSEFINLLAFDERFDDRRWTAEKVYTQNQSIDPKEQPFIINQQRVYTNSDSQLTISIEDFMSASGQNKISKATHYALQTASYVSPVVAFENTDPKVTAHINAFLNKQIDRVDMLSLETTPIAKAWLSDTKTLLWYQGKVLVELNGASVNTVYFLENPMQSTGEAQAWEINNMVQYQSLQSSLDSLPDDIFQLGDVIEITRAHYVQELIFYELADEPVLISSKIAIY